MPRAKDKPFLTPSFHVLMTDVTNEERMQMEAVGRAISEKSMIGKLVTNWCVSCGRWRLQFVSTERIKTITESDSFLCTKCGTPIKLILEKSHVLMSS